MRSEKSTDSDLSVQKISGLLGLSEGSYKISVSNELASTNTEVKMLADKGACAGTVIIADSQTGGRGRLGRSFHSPAGCGLYMTVLLRPENPDPARITTFAAVATALALEELCRAKIDIKWVNDLYIDGKKVCGILAEGGINPTSGRLAYVALGIGINVGNKSFPDEISGTATSVFIATGKRISRSELAAEILKKLLPLMSEKLPVGYMDEYRRRSYITGKEIWLLHGEGKQSATAIGIDDSGALIVKLPDGDIQNISTGDVSIRLRDKDK